MVPLILDSNLYLRKALDAMPAAVFIVDQEVIILDANQAAKTLFCHSGDLLQRQLCGNVINCIHPQQEKKCCGDTKFCPDCVIRQTVHAARHGTPVKRRTACMILQQGDRIRTVWFLVTVTPFTVAEKTLFLLVLEDVTEVAELRRMIPICMHCRKVRDDANYWHQVEDYLTKYTGIEFSHGLCHTCLKKLYPDQADDVIQSMPSPDRGK